jgi:fido (protein-threonine AMPylation protein)
MESRPKDNEELEKRAAIGVIRASRFVRNYARTQKKIDILAVKLIHKEIWKDAWPEIAGEYRIEDLKISDSKLLLPHYSEVPHLMQNADYKFTEKIKNLGDDCMGKISSIDQPNNELIQCIDNVVSLAAWLHHKITCIHPFREGNGRTARLAANLILERYSLVGISVKVEKENKNTYRSALSQIDKAEDYEPLKNLIYEGLEDRYNGVAVKYYPFARE